MTIEVRLDGTKELSKALVEAFSPLTETLGALGDRIRIYRQISLLKSLRRAQQIIESEGLRPTEPPLKFLVPFLEDCSLEDSEHETIIEMWARLLANASNQYKSEHNLFIRMLREITPAEAKLFDFIISPATHSLFKEYRHIEDVESDWRDEYLFIGIQRCVEELGGLNKIEKMSLWPKLEELFKSKEEAPGSVIYFFDVAKGQRDKYPRQDVYVPGRGPIDDDFEPISISILKGLGLIADYKSPDLWLGEYVFTVFAYHVTLLGAHFAQACTRPDPPLAPAS